MFHIDMPFGWGCGMAVEMGAGGGAGSTVDPLNGAADPVTFPLGQGKVRMSFGCLTHVSLRQNR